MPYNITSWLDKNKDPINESVVNLLSESKEKLVAELFPPPDAGGVNFIFMLLAVIYELRLHKTSIT